MRTRKGEDDEEETKEEEEDGGEEEKEEEEGEEELVEIESRSSFRQKIASRVMIWRKRSR